VAEGCVGVLVCFPLMIHGYCGGFFFLQPGRAAILHCRS
jgi:hypothetical protein